MDLISVKDLLHFARGHFYPSVCMSPYRYLEHLLEVTLARKYRRRQLLEIGPGADPFIDHIDPEEFATVALMDYQPQILKQIQQRLSLVTKRPITLIESDVDEPGVFKNLGTAWDYVVANALLEHLKNDASFINGIHKILPKGGIFVGSTVLGPRLYNLWDHAVGHYRRYDVEVLRSLFDDFETVQLIQTSLIQELVRPLFFSRIAHLKNNTIAENNRCFNEQQAQFGRPPFERLYLWGQKLFPLWMAVDWTLRNSQGGIGIVIARK